MIKLNNVTQKPQIYKPNKNATVYHTESWQRGGYIRHYKSGKEVYIKPTTCSRGNNKKDVAPKTLIVK